MNCNQITKIITYIPGLKKTIDSAIKKEVSVQDGLDAKKSILESFNLANEAVVMLEMKYAEKLFGQDFLGPKAIETVFGPDAVPTVIPRIPFSRDELEEAKKLGQFLVLRTSQITDEKLLLPNTKRTLEKAPETRWALVTKDLMPNSTNKNYLEQIEEIVKYLREQVFLGCRIPKEYQKAIAEFEAQKEELRTLSENPDETIWEPASYRLANLQINQLIRRNQEEALYDLELYKQTNNEYLLTSDRFDWTCSIDRRYTDGSLVYVGYSSSGSVYVSGMMPGFESDYLGVAFSRTS